MRSATSAIVRIEQVHGFELNANGEYDVRLVDGTLLRSSRRYRKVLAASLNALRPVRRRAPSDAGGR